MAPNDEMKLAVGALVACTDALHDAVAEIAHALQSPIGGTALEVIQARLNDANEARATVLRSLGL